MKTVKEAYESVGLVPAIGDKIGDPSHFELESCPTLTWVDGWFYDVATIDAGLVVYNAGKSEWRGYWVIQRDGKQVCPRVEGLESESIMREFKKISSTTLPDIVSRLIDAKIKEKMGG